MNKSHKYQSLYGVNSFNTDVDKWLLDADGDLKLIYNEIEKTGRIEGFGFEQFINDDDIF